MSGSMSFSLNIAWITTVFLVATRLGAMLLMTPILAVAAVPLVVRVLLILALAVLLTMNLPLQTVLPLQNPGAMFVAMFTELVLGATMALGILIAFSAFSLAGQILDVQIGYSIAQLVDPITRRQTPILTTAFNQLAIVSFFAADLHHALLRGLRYSFEYFPLGQPWLLQPLAPSLLMHVGGLFSLGLMLVAPVAFCLLLVEFTMSVLTRNLPQMNMFALAIPIKVIIGLIMLSLWFAGMSQVANRVYASIFQTWEGLFSHV